MASRRSRIRHHRRDRRKDKQSGYHRGRKAKSSRVGHGPTSGSVGYQGHHLPERPILEPEPEEQTRFPIWEIWKAKLLRGE